MSFESGSTKPNQSGYKTPINTSEARDLAEAVLQNAPLHAPASDQKPVLLAPTHRETANLIYTAEQNLQWQNRLLQRLAPQQDGRFTQKNPASHPAPPCITKAAPPYLYDTAGEKWLDLTASNGALLLSPDPDGFQFAWQEISGFLPMGISTQEIELAEWITEHIPVIERICFTATPAMARERVIQIAQSWSVKSNSAKTKILQLSTSAPDVEFSLPSAAEEDADLLYVNPHLQSVLDALDAHHQQIAAIVVEPLKGFPPLLDRKLLHALRDVCDRENVVLISDETTTALRAGAGSALEQLGVMADLTILSPIIGGGLLLGGYGGRDDLMQIPFPDQSYHPTASHEAAVSPSLVAMATGLLALKHAQQTDVWHTLNLQAADWANTLNPILQLFFTSKSNQPHTEVCVATGGVLSFNCNQNDYHKLHLRLLQQHIITPTDGAWLLGIFHDKTTLQQVCETLTANS